MPRRRAKLDLTLFPFLSVLSGLIAVMVLLMIVTVSTRVISAEAVAPPPELKDQGGGPKSPLDRTEEEGIDPASYARLEEQIAESERVLEDRLAARDKVALELQKLTARINKLEAERVRVANIPRKGVRIGEPTRVKIIPALGTAVVGKSPVFIEVDVDGYIVHPEKTRYAAERKKVDAEEKVSVPPDLVKVIEGMAPAGTKYPLLLVRPNGTVPFDALLDRIKEIQKAHPNLSVGWEPFAREWLLDNK